MSSADLASFELIPPIISNVVPRTRLFEAIDRVGTSRMIWIGGAPGAGKSSLVGSYAADRRRPSHWFPATALVDSSATLTWWRDAVRAMPANGLMVFEDCHALTQKSLFANALAELQRAVGPGQNLILIGRGDPPSDCGPLIARGALSVLAAQELQFSLEETRFLAGADGINDAVLHRLHQRFAGWTTGIAIALEALRRHAGNWELMDYELQRTLSTYFRAQVFDQATTIERHVMVCSALLPRLSRRSVEVLSGIPGGWAVLTELALRHWFIASTADGTTSTLEYMPAFRDFLLSEVTCTLTADQLPELRKRAGALFDLNSTEPWLGLSDLRAAFHALQRGEFAECHQLLYTALPAAEHSPAAAQACMFFPSAMGQLCREALRQGIAADAARHIIERFEVPPPEGAGPEWPWPFRVNVLGRFRLLKADMPIRFSRRAQRKPLELLQALIAFGGTDVGAGTLTEALWPDSEGDAAYHALESALYRLRHLLGAADAIRMAGGKLSLDRRQFWVDLWDFERALRMPRYNDTTIAQRAAQARQLYEGHFLEHESEKPWAVKVRLSLRDRLLRATRDAARAHEARREWQSAAQFYESGIGLDELAEDLYRGLMICHQELGNHSQALLTYRRCRELLTRLLGVPPSAKTDAIYHGVRKSAVSCAA